MSYVKGKNVTVYVYRDIAMVPTPVMMGCATSISKNETAEEVNVTTADSTRENEYIGGSKDAVVTVDGLMTLDELTRWQYKDWLDSLGNVERFLITHENAFGDKYSYDFNGLITGVSDQAGPTEFASFSASIKRTGPATTTMFYDALLDSDGNPILDSDGNLIR